MVVLAVTWMAKVGNESAVASIFAKLTEESRKEPGCTMYQVHRHKTDPRRFFIYEMYRDEAAFTEHNESDHFKRYVLGEALPRLQSRERTFFEPLE